MNMNLDLNHENVPQSYRDFMANMPASQDTSMFYDGQEYAIYSIKQLSEKYDPQSPPYYQWLGYADLEYKALEGELDDITLEQIRKAFCFGWVNAGKIFFHPENHSVWEIYSDLFVRKIADSFEQFIKDAELI